MNNIKYICFDCKRELENGEEFMPYENPENKEEVFIKCKNCHKKDPLLKNWRAVETWSRVVGYFRPVQNWSKQKAQEFKDRKVFKIK